MTRLSKPVVVFLDDEEVVVREEFLKRFGIDPSLVRLYSPHMCITNLGRYGEKLSNWVVRTSDIKPHFINRDRYKNALVYGKSDWIGDSLIRTSEYTFTVPPLQYDEHGNILPATVDWLQCDYVNRMIKIADNIVLGDIECR